MAATGVFRPIRPSYPTWVEIVFNAVQHLALLHPDRHFFHYYHDICRYIDKNWEQLAGGKPRSPTWPNTVSSTVTCNKTVFRAGPTAGLWGLRDEAMSELPPSPAPSPRKRRLPLPSHSARRRAYRSSASDSEEEEPISLSFSSEVEESKCRSQSRSGSSNHSAHSHSQSPHCPRSPEAGDLDLGTDGDGEVEVEAEVEIGVEDQLVDIEGLSSEDKMEEETPLQRGSPPQDCPAPKLSSNGTTPAAYEFVPFVASSSPLACSPHAFAAHMPARSHLASSSLPGTSPLGSSPSWPHSFGTHALVRDDWFSSLFND